MSVNGPETRSHEELLRIAQERLAVTLGGQWALSVTARENEQKLYVSQTELRREQQASEESLVALGLLASSNTTGRLPYFVR